MIQIFVQLGLMWDLCDNMLSYVSAHTFWFNQLGKQTQKQQLGQITHWFFSIYLALVFMPPWS